MRSHWSLLFAVVFLAGAAAGAQTTSSETEGSAEIGAWDASTEGNPDVVSEYESEDGGLDLRLELRSDNEGGTVELDAQLRDDDQVLSLGFDVGRSLRSETAYTALIHRLGFRSLDHFAAATNHGRLTRHTDMAPGQKFAIDYTLLEHRTEFQPKGMDNLTLAVGYRQQEREGMRQQTNVSHCDSCHVINQARPVDESTTDARLEAQIAWDGGQVTASLVNREFTDDSAAIFLLYDDALHPELRAPVFDNRLQYDSAEGPQRVGQQPNIDKEILEIDGSFDDVGGFAVNAGGAWSTTENRLTGNEASYSGAVVSAARLFKNWNLALRSRSYSLENDDVFVDNIERLGIAGPQAGRTYREIYGYDPDFLRQSALDRQVFETNLDLSRRLGGKKGRVKLSWDYKTVDRDHLEVAPGDTKSVTNVLSASWRARPKKGWKTQLGFKHGETDNPFMHVDGTYSPFTSGSSPNPFLPQAAQYYESHAARIADTTASPSSWDELTARASHSAGNHTLTASYRMWDGDNNDGDLTEWSRSVQSATIAFWSAPAEEWDWHVAYTFNETELDMPASIPLFDG
jgi:hypothetical protein